MQWPEYKKNLYTFPFTQFTESSINLKKVCIGNRSAATHFKC